METIELDLSEFDRDLLEALIVKSCEQDVSITTIINNILKEYLNTHETSNI